MNRLTKIGIKLGTILFFITIFAFTYSYKVETAAAYDVKLTYTAKADKEISSAAFSSLGKNLAERKAKIKQYVQSDYNLIINTSWMPKVTKANYTNGNPLKFTEIHIVTRNKTNTEDKKDELHAECDFPGNIAGCYNGNFIIIPTEAFLKTTDYRSLLTVHEMLHANNSAWYWGSCRAKGEENCITNLHLHEGFTDYFARKIAGNTNDQIGYLDEVRIVKNLERALGEVGHQSDALQILANICTNGSILDLSKYLGKVKDANGKETDRIIEVFDKIFALDYYPGAPIDSPDIRVDFIRDLINGMIEAKLHPKAPDPNADPNISQESSGPCFPGAYYAKNSIQGNYTGMEAVVTIGQMTPDPNRFAPVTYDSVGYCKAQDNAAIYMGIKNASNGEEVDIGLNWEVAIDGTGGVSNSQSAFRPFWRTSKGGKWSVPSLNTQWSSGDTITMTIKIPADDQLVFTVSGAGKSFTSPIIPVKIKKNEAHQLKFVSSVDQMGNENRPTQTTSAKFVGTKWQSRKAFVGDLTTSTEIANLSTETKQLCPSSDSVIKSVANKQIGAETISIIGLPYSQSKKPTPTCKPTSEFDNHINYPIYNRKITVSATTATVTWNGWQTPVSTAVKIFSDSQEKNLVKEAHVFEISEDPHTFSAEATGLSPNTDYWYGIWHYNEITEDDQKYGGTIIRAAGKLMRYYEYDAVKFTTLGAKTVTSGEALTSGEAVASGEALTSGETAQSGETAIVPPNQNGKNQTGTVTIEKSSDVASTAGDPVTIKTYLSGNFENAALKYNLYISTKAVTSEPTEEVTNTSVWADKSPTENGFILSADQISEGIIYYNLQDIVWDVSDASAIGKHYVKAVITDAMGSVVATGVSTIDVVEDAVSLTLTANGLNYVPAYDMTTNSAPINIAIAMTPSNPSSVYSAALYISGKGYASNAESHSDEAGAMFQKDSWENLSGFTTKSFAWDTKAGDGSAVGNHQVLVKVFDTSTTPSKLIGSKYIWVKLCNKTDCGTGITPTEGDTSKLNLSGALGAVGINVDFTSYKSVVTFLKDKWFPTIVGMFAFLGIIYSAWLYIMSAGDQAKADKGKKGLVYSIIGIAIAVGANVIINVATNAKDKFANATSIVGDKNSIFSKTTDLIAVISGMLAFIYLIYSGILYLTAAGNPDNAKKGLQGVINASIGIVIIVAAWAIIGAVTGTLGSYFK